MSGRVSVQHPVWERVAALCEQLSRWPKLAEAVGEGGGRAELAALLELVASPAEPEPARVTAVMDAVDQALAKLGLGSLTSRTGSFLDPSEATKLPPGMASARRLFGWTCPLGRCSRVVLPEEAAGTPVCAVRNGPMLPCESPTR